MDMRKRLVGDKLCSFSLQDLVMYFRRCRVSVSNLKRIFTVIVLFTVGVIVGLAPKTLESKPASLKASKAAITEMRSATPTTAAKEATVENFTAANNSYYIQVAKDVPIKSWTRTATDSEENPEDFECSIRVPTLHFTNKFSHLPLSFLKYNAKPHPMPKCGSLLFPWAQMEQRAWMIFIVKTSPNNFERRKQIRETWGSIEVLRKKRLVVLFVVGRAAGLMEEQALSEENQLFGDILQCEFEDSYKSLPLKVLSAMRYLLEGHIDSQFYTVTDDDCVMHLMNIVTFFDRAAKSRVLYCGFLYDKDLKPNRKKGNKWKVDMETYDQTYYPTFCHGGMWTVTKSFMRELYCMAELTNRSNFHLEDVYITGILREKLGHQHRDIEPVVTQNGKKYELMYYPWDDTERGALKMQSRWQRMNRTLPWGQQRSPNSQALVLRATRSDTVKNVQLQATWRAIQAKRKNLTSRVV